MCTSRVEDISEHGTVGQFAVGQPFTRACHGGSQAHCLPGVVAARQSLTRSTSLIQPVSSLSRRDIRFRGKISALICSGRTILTVIHRPGISEKWTVIGSCGAGQTQHSALRKDACMLWSRLRAPTCTCTYEQSSGRSIRTWQRRSVYPLVH